jgi:hypothetical protein
MPYMINNTIIYTLCVCEIECREKCTNLSVSRVENNRSENELRLKNEFLSVSSPGNRRPLNEVNQNPLALSPESNRSVNEHIHTLELSSDTKS